MPTLENALESLATRGSPRGPDALIEGLEMGLTSPDAVARLRPVPTIDRERVKWRRGLAVAVAASFVVLVLGGIGVLLATLVGAPAPGDPASPVTTQIPSDTPTSPELLFDGMVMRDGDVIGIFQDAQFVPLLADECCVANAMSDLAGGVVFQRDDNAVLWTSGAAATRGGDPVVLIEGGAAERVSLEDVAVIAGEPTVVYVRTESTEGAERHTLATVGLVSDERSDVAVLSEDNVVADRVSYAGGMYLVTVIDGDGTWFEFRDESGAVVTVANNQRSAPGDILVSQGLLAEEGAVMIFIERQPEDAGGGLADLVTFDLERGVEVTRNHIANFGDRIIAFDGDRVIVARQRANPELPPIMVGLHLGQSATLTSDGGFSVGPFGN